MNWVPKHLATQNSAVNQKSSMFLQININEMRQQKNRRSAEFHWVFVFHHFYNEIAIDKAYVTHADLIRNNWPNDSIFKQLPGSGTGGWLNGSFDRDGSICRMVVISPAEFSPLQADWISAFLDGQLKLLGNLELELQFLSY